MKVNSKVVSDKFDNEIVVVNLENGFYYSLRNAAVQIWNLVEQQYSLDRVIAAFANLSADEENDVRKFVEFLIEDKLVVESEEIRPAIPQALLPYSKPEYSRFEDMADLIMIDPIHEADPTKGWPIKPG